MQIQFSDARYIKLGRAGCWNDASLDGNEIHFGFGDVPHELALSLDRDALIDHQVRRGRSQRVAAEDAREIIDFYSLPESCLWITFARDHMWWAFAQSGVIWVGGEGSSNGFRKRKCVGAWSRFDISKEPLTLRSLSSLLTQVSAYRRTICELGAKESYLKRRLNCDVSPVVAEAQTAQKALTDILGRAIADLHQTDFETLVDLLLSRSGWQRISALGGTQEFIDLAVVHPATGERAAVQVKARADRTILRDYIERFDAAGSYARLFFACHSPDTVLMSDRPDVHIWQGPNLANIVSRLGLTEWVLEKVS